MRMIYNQSRPILLAATLALTLFPISAQAASAPRTIKVTSVPLSFSVLDRTRKDFGKLSWRGGIELISEEKRFGGFSGIAIETDGSKFVSVSDDGSWISGDLEYKQDTITKAAHIKIAPMLNRKGRRYKRKWLHDAESIAPFGNKGLRGKLLVGFERIQRIGVYKYGKKGLKAREKTIELPSEANEARNNKELESVGRFASNAPRLAKTIIAISERFLDDQGNIIGWLVGGATPGRFTIKRLRNFDITDLTITPDNELIILERYFSALTGVEMRLRKIDVAALKPGALLTGEILMEANQVHTIDNMEGLASHRAANGETILTLISDDNFNAFQRTLLLQFALKK